MDFVALPAQAYRAVTLAERAEILLAHLAGFCPGLTEAWLMLGTSLATPHLRVQLPAVPAALTPIPELQAAMERALNRPITEWNRNAINGLWWISIPLRADAELLGVVGLQGYGDAPDAAQIESLEQSAEAAALLLREKRCTEQQQRGDKLRALGECMSRVAHEINNPLTSILGYTELLGMTDWNNPFLRQRALDRIEKISKEAERATNLARSLLTYARRPATEQTAFNLNELVREVTELYAERYLAQGVEIRQQLDAALPDVIGNRSEIQQVCINLLTNAFQAIQGQRASGCITLLTERTPVGGVTLKVQDDGPGIRPEDRERIFDPFFTTKPAGQSTGLGLAICRDLMEAHRGTLEVTSEYGQGALFCLNFPPEVVTIATRRPSLTLLKNAPAEPDLPQLHIAVLDDEELVVEMLLDTLTEQGHQVTCFLNPHEALHALENGMFDVILSDMKMPQMSGMEFHAEAARRNPEQAARILFLTGDIQSTAAQEFFARTGCLLLPKPFRQSELLTSIATLLRRYPPHAAATVQAQAA